MLKCVLHVWHLPLLGRAAELPNQLGALRKTGRSEGMSLRQQAARRIGHDLAAIGVSTIKDELLGVSFRRETERLVHQKFIDSEAIVQLHNLNILGADAGQLVDCRSGVLCHVVTAEFDHRAFVEGVEFCR